MDSAQQRISLTIVALTVLGIWLPGQSWAEISLYDQGGAKAALTLEGGAGFVYNDKVNFGAGRFGDSKDPVTWQEGYLKPLLNLSYATTGTGTFYGGLSYVASGTSGDGDSGGFTSDADHGISKEQAYAGWKSGTLLSAFGENALDISVGSQEFSIGDGFLIMDGNYDGKKGAYWLGPHRAFDETALLRIKTTLLNGDLFYLKSGADSAHTELSGLNIEHVDPQLGTIGASWMNVAGADSGFYENREGMQIYSIRAQGTPLAALGEKDIFFAFQYVRENQGDRLDVDATAWYGEAGYTFSQLPWKPTLSYRYAFFSGDKDPDDNKYQSFDPMFYGFSRGWGTHFMGEITGEYFLFNSNEKVNMVHLKMSPSDTLSVGLIYYDFCLDQKNIFGTPVTSDKFADEVNLYADYTVNDHVTLSIVGAWAAPGTAAKEYTGGNDNSMLVEASVIVSF